MGFDSQSNLPPALVTIVLHELVSLALRVYSVCVCVCVKHVVRMQQNK